ncbi:protease modulator HflC [Orientia tsutsugamushi]|uniref:Protein HflC n=6 Tax=Orientia tsutsugamushi TaxID=784 RepID=A0A2U3QSF3_ORITS|nr:protease modulator HflC [Orientia tsutsugamushi]KJV55620.1 hflC protein [Orientia tsutsugamushi str. Kato PP]KJV56944.1 hflC protein [Orientia tsutsugamushi str. Karp]SPR03881.1 protease modulator HflC [Orientia tsutsugamushi]SPR14421.1 protease modulator HflC [Orientia tsutsugamushi]BAG40776.1 HflC protein [Orientia tsutsugamushi str. Ikeda]
MTIKKVYLTIVIAVVAVLAIFNSVFQVMQNQYAVVFQFGEAVKVISEPGLRFKVPFVQNVLYFDKRLVSVEVSAKELTAADGKRVIVNAFAKFKIIDPITFFKTVYNHNGVKIRLNKTIESAMRKVIGRATFITLLSKQRSEIMSDIYDLVNKEGKSFGVDVIDVRISRTDLPKENSAAIYQRMQTEREKEAKQIRAEGKEEAVRIISRADKECDIILAEAYKQAKILEGEGDAEASHIYNSVYSQDPEFYRFYQSLLTYSKVLRKDDTSFVLSPNSELFKFLNLSNN